MEDLLKYIGYDLPEGETEAKIEDVKKHIDDKFVAIAQLGEKKEILKPFIDKSYGKLARQTQVSIVKALKDHGLDASHSEFDQIATIDELLPVAIGKFKEQISKGSGATDKEIEEKYKKTIEDLKKENVKFKTEYSTLEGEHTSFKNQVQQREKDSKINSFREKLFGSVKFRSDIKPLEKDGFKTKFNESYRFDVTEEGKVELRDKEGNKMWNPDRKTEELTPEKAVELFAKANDVLDASPHDGKQVKKEKPRERRETDPPRVERKVNPRFSGAV